MNTNSSAKVHPLAAANTFWVMGDQVRKRGKLEGTAFNVVDVIIPPAAVRRRTPMPRRKSSASWKARCASGAWLTESQSKPMLSPAMS